MGIQNVIQIYGAATGHRNSNKYNFKATSEVSVNDCEGHIYIYTYIHTYMYIYIYNAQQLRHQD